MGLTLQESQQQASIISEITSSIILLNIGYLKESLESMKSNHSFRDAAAVLNPNPFTHIEQQELNALKIKQLEQIIKLAENLESIKNAESRLKKAKVQVQDLSKMFGI